MDQARPKKRAAKFEANLRALVELLNLDNLRREGVEGLDARSIAARMRCSKPTVYTRIGELLHRGYVLNIKEARVGERGPEASLFAVTGNPIETALESMKDP